jgi:N-acetylmuramoyl-L-alanine amidase
VLLGGVAHAVELIDTAVPGERLYLDDPVQDRHTTSINWVDKLFVDPSPGLAVRPPPVEIPDVSDLEPSPGKPLRVVVDVGHGGRDLGAVGLNGVVEKELSLRIGELVKRELERQRLEKDIPLEVLLTREDDSFVSLQDRVRRANAWGADLFVSIHGNSSPSPKAHGFEVYFLSAEASDAAAKKLAHFENAGQATQAPLRHDVLSILSDVEATNHVAESSRLAETLFQAMSRRLRPNGRGVRQAPFTVLVGTEMPAVLVEVGYLTHLEETKKLNRALYLKRLAGAISTGIIEFANRLRKLSLT